MRVIDAHVHFWRLARGDNVALSPAMTPIWRDSEPDDLAARRVAAGVAQVVAVQAAETLAETLYLVGLARRHPEIVGVVAWIEPASPAVAEEAAALAALPVVKGVRPIRDDNRSIAYLLDARLAPGWDALAGNGLTLDVLVQNWREIPLATMLARRMPTIGIILDHCGKPDIAGGGGGARAEAIAELATCANVTCKLSGLMNCAAAGAGVAEIAAYADHVIAAFGPGRVMWASDWPPLDLASSYGAWRGITDEILGARPEADRARILAGTAAEVYRLPSPPETRP